MSNNQEKLNEQLGECIRDEKITSQTKLRKVKFLVRLGADVNARLYGKSVLSKAIELQDEEVVSFLKNKGANEWVVSKEEAERLGKQFWDDKGDLKSLEEIKELLKKGADVNASDKYGQTALYWAATLGKLDVVKCLAECGADVEAKDGDGRTALMKLASWGKLDVVKCLVEFGADVEAKDKNGRTALTHAASYVFLNVVMYLVEQGADLEAKDKDGRTALDIARMWGKTDCVKFLEECQSKEEGDRKKGVWQRIFGGRD